MSQKKTVAGTPADPTSGFVPLELDGKKFQLAFDFDAVARVEEQTGLSLLIGINWRNMQVRQLRALFHASLLKAQPETRIEDLTRYIVPRHTGMIVNALVDAWIAATPETSEADSQNAIAQNPPPPEA